MSLNKKMLILLAVVVAELLVLPFSWDLAAVPFLVFLVCPLAVLVMMGESRSGVGDSGAGAAWQEDDDGPLSDQAIDERIRVLQAEMRELKAEQARRAETEETPTPNGASGCVGLDKPGPPAPRS